MPDRAITASLRAFLGQFDTPYARLIPKPRLGDTHAMVGAEAFRWAFEAALPQS